MCHGGIILERPKQSTIHRTQLEIADCFVRLTLVLSVAMAMAVSAAGAQDTAPVVMVPTITLGTRAGDRTSTKSAVPVDVLTSQAIEASGLVETWQILQRLIPTANSAHIPRGDDGTRPITLRGFDSRKREATAQSGRDPWRSRAEWKRRE